MCGRFVLSSPASVIAEEFHVDQYSLDLQPSYNVAPSQQIVIVRKEGVNKLAKCGWGFLPSWAKDPVEGRRMINARAETVADKPAFRAAFRDNRCLVVADGFFEWRKKGAKKTPLYIRLRSGMAFGLAGLYSVWTSPEGEKVCTCTIITTEANELLEPVHDRMPVIIPKDKHDLWLDPAEKDRDRLLALLRPYDPLEMEAFQVSSKVNLPSYNAADVIEPEGLV